MLSGMSNIAQMEDNIATMKHFSPLNQAQLQVIAQAQAALAAIPSVPCTGCQYCVKGCPAGVAIPGIVKALNNLLIFGNREGALGNYSWETRHGGVASKCVACGQCESVCPQHIPIIQRLKEAAAQLEVQ